MLKAEEMPVLVMFNVALVSHDAQIDERTHNVGYETRPGGYASTWVRFPRWSLGTREAGMKKRRVEKLGKSYGRD